MRIIKINIIILLVFLLSGIGASGKDYDLIENSEFVFKYLPHNNSDYEINNFFIREIARYNLTGLYSTGFTMHYAIHKKIKHISLNTFAVEVELQSELLTGSTAYREFDISDILMPEMLDLKVHVEENGNYIISKELKGITWENDHVFQIHFAFEALDENKEYQLVVEDIHFYSDDEDKNAFLKRQKDVDNYYASIAAIDFAISKYNPGEINLNSLIASFVRIKELERVHQNLSNSEFITELKLDKNDPAGFHGKIVELEKEIIKYNYRFDVFVNSLDFIKLNTSIEKYATIYVNEITRFYMESQTVTHSNTAHFYKLGGLNYQNAYLANYSNGLKKFLIKTQYCNSIKSIENKLEELYFPSLPIKSKAANRRGELLHCQRDTCKCSSFL
ncbi:MAG: hypothetical protein R2764_09510 [Bacteroidales bacterium]